MADGLMTTQLLEPLTLRAVAPLTDATPELDCSVVIVTWNSGRWIERCLNSLLPEMKRGLKVVVYDNHSTDDTVARARRFRNGSVEIVRSEENHGFAYGVNRSIAATGSEYILLLNPDCELEEGALSAMIDFLDHHVEHAAVVPLLLEADGTPQREFQLRRFPTIGSVAAELLLVDEALPRNPFTARYRYRELKIEEPVKVEQPAAAAMLLRRSVVERIGPFDERFTPAWFEDVDYCRRLAEEGETIALLPAARGWHHGGASLEHISFIRFTEVWYRNLHRYAAKWFSPREVETFRWLVIVGMFLRIGALAVGFRRRAVKRRDALRAYRRVMSQAFNRWNDASPSS